MRGPIRKLSQDERMVWGECLVCHAEHGEACDGRVGISLGLNVKGERPTEGAHLARLQGAPFKVQEVRVD